jgi:hypothetical protein
MRTQLEVRALGGKADALRAAHRRGRRLVLNPPRHRAPELRQAKAENGTEHQGSVGHVAQEQQHKAEHGIRHEDIGAEEDTVRHADEEQAAEPAEVARDDGLVAIGASLDLETEAQAEQLREQSEKLPGHQIGHQDPEAVIEGDSGPEAVP